MFSAGALTLTADVELAADPEGDGERSVRHLAHHVLVVIRPRGREHVPGTGNKFPVCSSHFLHSFVYI